MKGFIVSFAIACVMALFRLWAPRNIEAESVEDNGRRLPFGIAGLIQCAVTVTVAIGGFFLFYSANRVWALADKGTILTIYPTKIIWCFASGFAALCIPYFTTLWLLRRFGYAGQAGEIIAKGNAKMNMDGMRIMRWLIWGLVLPVTILTILAIPMHLTVNDHAVLVTHYASLKSEVFSFSDAVAAYEVDGYILRDQSFKSHPDLVFVFADGRRLQATDMSDGGDRPPEKLVSALMSHTGLKPSHVKMLEDIPTTR